MIQEPSDIRTLSLRVHALIDLCESAGLAELARKLLAERGDRYSAIREHLLQVKIVATHLHAAIAHEHKAHPTTALHTIAERALRIETDASAAIVICDRVLAEQFERNAKGCEPGLAMSAKKLGGFR